MPRGSSRSRHHKSPVGRKAKRASQTLDSHLEYVLSRGDPATRNKDPPLHILIDLIVLALGTLKSPRGSTLVDIRNVLLAYGLIDETTDLRRAMIFGLKRCAIARPMWAVAAGIYGVYVEGDGVPIFAGRKSRPKEKEHKKTASAPKVTKRKQKSRSRTQNRERPREMLKARKGTSAGRRKRPQRH